jgi:hypothetical protein
VNTTQNIVSREEITMTISGDDYDSEIAPHTREINFFQFGKFIFAFLGKINSTTQKTAMTKKINRFSSSGGRKRALYLSHIP